MQPEQAPEPTNVEHELALRLAAYDEKRTVGAAPGLGDLQAGLSCSAAERLAADMECAARIRAFWSRPDILETFPQEFGKFVLERELGRGGHGVVFLAVDTTLGRHVALKIPRPECLDDADLRKRFLKEARAVAMLDHAGIVALLELGEVGPVCYMASTFCGGQDLRAWLKARQSPLSPRAAAHLAFEIATAIGHAHERGVVHRDLKPRNIMLEERADVSLPDGLAVRPRVTDFGLAKLMQTDADLTRTGVVIGTPRYMAPEQAQARHSEVGPATDVYSIGVILQELLIGRIVDVHEADQQTTPEILPGIEARRGLHRDFKLATSRLHASRAPGPAALRAILAKCLQQEPGRRYADATILAADLRRFLDGEPVHAARNYLRRPLTAWAASRPAIAVSIALIFSLIVMAVSRDRSSLSDGARAPLVLGDGTYDLARDWSDAANPGDVWSYLAAPGTPLVSHRDDWDPARLFFAAPQPVWSYKQHPLLSEIPLFMKVVTAFTNTASDAPIGTVLIHGNDPTSPPALRDQSAGFAWRAPRAGSIQISGGLWVVQRFQGRSAAWTLEVNGVSISSGILSSSAAITSSNPMQLLEGSGGTAALGATIAAGDVVRLMFTRPPGERFAALVGVNFAIRLNTARGPGPVKDTREQEAGRLARVNRFVDDMILAHDLSPVGLAPGFKLAQANFLLDRHRPTPGEEDIRSIEWYYLWNQLHGEQQTLADHKGEVYWLTYAPDGLSLASAGVDGARIWDASTGKLRLSLRQHSDEVVWACFSPDSKWLATASDDHSARVWNAIDGSPVSPPLIHQDKVLAVLFTPDGKQLITGDRGGFVTIWDAATGAEVRPFRASISSPLEGMALSPDGTLLATAASTQVMLWKFPSLRKHGKPIRTAGPGHRFDCVSFSHDGRWFATASGSEERVRVWDTQTGSLVFSGSNTPERVMSVAFSPDDRTLLSTSSDLSARLWDLSGGHDDAILAGHADWVWCGAFAPDGKTLATTGRDRTVKLWTLPRARPESRIDPNMDHSFAVGYSADGRQLYTSKDDGSCQIWDSESGRMLERLPFAPDKPAVAGTFAPGSARLAVVDAAGTISIGLPRESKPLIILSHAAAKNSCLTFSSDSRALAFVAQDGSVGRVDTTRSTSTIETLEAPGSAPSCLAFAPGGQLLAAGIDRRLALWDLRTARLRGHSSSTTQGDITAVAVCPARDLIATNGQGAEILIWDSATLRVRATLRGATNRIDCVAFSADGRTLVSGGGAGEIIVWNVATTRPMFELKGPDLDMPAVLGLCVAPGGIAAVIRDERLGKTKTAVWRITIATPNAGK